MRSAVLAAAALCAAAAPASAATYFVSPAGSDANPGSQAAPFRQIRRAVGVAGPGDLVSIADGQYLGFDVKGKHGSAGAPIVLKAEGAGAMVVPTRDRPDDRDTIFVTLSSDVVLDGLRSFNANRAAIRIDQSQRVTVRNGVYGGNGTWGIFADFSADLLLEKNECYGSRTQHGIYCSNSGDRPVIRGNRLHHNYGSGLHLNGDASQGGDGIISGAVVENNLVYANGSGGGSGIDLDGVQDGIVRNNLLYSNQASGIAAYRMDSAAGPRNLQVLNNTVDQPSGSRWALLVQNSAGRVTVRNNILLNRGTFRGSLCFGSNADAANADADYNVLEWVSRDNGESRLSLAQWKASGRDQHSFSALPGVLFLNPAAADYHLQPTAPAVDRGCSLNDVLFDLEDHPRPYGPSEEIGCYEFSDVTVDVTRPAAPAGLTAVAGEAAVNLTWKANSDGELGGYHVYRSGAPNGTWARQTASPVAGDSYVSSGLTAGTTYWYRVTAVDTAGVESAPTPPVSATIRPAPQPETPPVIYDDLLKRGWTARQARAAVSLRASSPVAEGRASIALTVTGKEGYLLLSGGSLSTAGKTVLKFKLHGGAKGGQTLRLRAVANGVQKRSINLWSYGGRPRKGQWVECAVPLSALGVSGSELTGLKFSAGRPQKRATLDYIRLE